MSVSTQIKQDWERAIKEAVNLKQGEVQKIIGKVYSINDDFSFDLKEHQFTSLKGLENEAVKSWCGDSGIVKSTRKEATILVCFEIYHDNYGWLAHGKNYWLTYQK